MNKYNSKNTADIKDAINNLANECSRMNDVIDVVMKLVMEEKTQSEKRREVDPYYKKQELENLKFHRGDKLEVVELGENTDCVHVGDVFTVDKIKFGDYVIEIVVKKGDVEITYNEHKIKNMIEYGYLKLVK